MNIERRQMTVQKYVMVLSEEEVADAIKDPRTLVTELKRVSGDINGLKAALGHASADVTNKHVKAVRQARKSPLKKNSAKKSGRGVKVATAAPAGKFQCEHCDRSFKTQGWLNQHQYKSHGGGNIGQVEIGTYGNGGDD
jgi:hypothetical protein